MPFTNLPPSYLVGRNLSLFGISGVNADANGNFFPDPQFDLANLGVFDHFQYEAERNLVQVQPGNAIIENNVPTYFRFTITISELERGDRSSYLQDIWNYYAYLRVDVIAQAPAYGTGNNITGKRFVCIGALGSIGDGIVEDKNAIQGVLKPCGVLPWWGYGTPPY